MTTTRRRRRTTWLPATLVVCALTLTTASAWADEAEVHFQRGVELYSEADYRAALLEFKRAYQLDPRWQVLYNIALSDYQILDYAGALGAFERYLKEGGAEISAARRAEVDREVKKLHQRVASLTITVSVPGAQISVDDVAVATSPLREPVRVSAGHRKITASAAGHAPSTVSLDLVGGDEKQITFDLEATGPASAAVAGPAVAAGAAPPRRIPWIGWIATGALAVGTGVTGGLALSASSDLKSKLGTFGVAQSDIDSAHGKTVALGIVADALLGATAVAGGISLYFTLRTPSPDATQVGVVAGPRGGRLEVSF